MSKVFKNKADLKKQFTTSNPNKEQHLVFTNGCFDILHAGHIDYLNKAKAKGDKLVVAVNSDASVKKLKGLDRPIFPIEQRLEILSGLSSVDYLIAFDDATPIELIKFLKPNVLIKGGDYVVKEIVGYKEVIESGGKVETISFKYDISTSKIIEKLKSH